MKYIISIIILLNISFNLLGQDNTKTIVLTRTLSQLVGDKNQFTISLSETGDVKIIHPVTHILHGNLTSFKNKNIDLNQEVFSKINVNWSTQSINKNLNSAKFTNKQHLFYSSDPDLLELSLFENNTKTWGIVINKFEEIKHYNKISNNFTNLIDLIENIQQISTDLVKLARQEKLK